MDAFELATRVAAVERRSAGSEAERRAAVLLAEALRETGRRRRRTTMLETVWIRPHRGPVHALLAAAAVVGSALSVAHPAVGLGLVAGALLLLVGDLSGRVTPLRRLTYERATQNVVSREAREARVRRGVSAPVDVPTPGLVGRGSPLRREARLRRSLRGRLPGPYGVLVLALIALVGCALARVLGAGGSTLGAFQLLPSVLVLLGLGAALDQAAADAPRTGANANASAAGTAVALVAALDADPPTQLAVDVVLAGAGGAHALGFRHWLREERRAGRRPEEIVVLELAACGAGSPVFRERDGLLLPLRFHPRLRTLAAEAGFAPHEAREASGARAARGLRWPALVVGCVDRHGVAPRLAEDTDTAERLDPGAMDATLAACLRLVRTLDAELAGTPVPDASPRRRATRVRPPGLPRRAPVEQPSDAAWRARPPSAPPVQVSEPPAQSARAARRAASSTSADRASDPS